MKLMTAAKKITALAVAFTFAFSPTQFSFAADMTAADPALDRQGVSIDKPQNPDLAEHMEGQDQTQTGESWEKSIQVVNAIDESGSEDQYGVDETMQADTALVSTTETQSENQVVEPVTNNVYVSSIDVSSGPTDATITVNSSGSYSDLTIEVRDAYNNVQTQTSIYCYGYCSTSVSGLSPNSYYTVNILANGSSSVSGTSSTSFSTSADTSYSYYYNYPDPTSYTNYVDIQSLNVSVSDSSSNMANVNFYNYGNTSSNLVLRLKDSVNNQVSETYLSNCYSYSSCSQDIDISGLAQGQTYYVEVASNDYNYVSFSGTTSTSFTVPQRQETQIAVTGTEQDAAIENLDVSRETYPSIYKVTSIQFECAASPCGNNATDNYYGPNGTFLGSRQYDSTIDNNTALIQSAWFDAAGTPIDLRKKVELIEAADFLEDATKAFKQKPIFQLTISGNNCTGEACTQVVSPDRIEYYNQNKEFIGYAMNYWNDRQEWFGPNGETLSIDDRKVTPVEPMNLGDTGIILHNNAGTLDFDRGTNIATITSPTNVVDSHKNAILFNVGSTVCTELNGCETVMASLPEDMRNAQQIATFTRQQNLEDGSTIVSQWIVYINEPINFGEPLDPETDKLEIDEVKKQLGETPVFKKDLGDGFCTDSIPAHCSQSTSYYDAQGSYLGKKLENYVDRTGALDSIDGDAQQNTNKLVTSIRWFDRNGNQIKELVLPKGAVALDPLADKAEIALVSSILKKTPAYVYQINPPEGMSDGQTVYEFYDSSFELIGKKTEGGIGAFVFWEDAKGKQINPDIIPAVKIDVSKEEILMASVVFGKQAAYKKIITPEMTCMAIDAGCAWTRAEYFDANDKLIGSRTDRDLPSDPTVFKNADGQRIDFSTRIKLGEIANIVFGEMPAYQLLRKTPDCSGLGACPDVEPTHTYHFFNQNFEVIGSYTEEVGAWTNAKGNQLAQQLPLNDSDKDVESILGKNPVLKIEKEIDSNTIKTIYFGAEGEIVGTRTTMNGKTTTGSTVVNTWRDAHDVMKQTTVVTFGSQAPTLTTTTDHAGRQTYWEYKIGSAVRSTITTTYPDSTSQEYSRRIDRDYGDNGTIVYERDSSFTYTEVNGLKAKTEKYRELDLLHDSIMDVTWNQSMRPNGTDYELDSEIVIISDASGNKLSHQTQIYFPTKEYSFESIQYAADGTVSLKETSHVFYDDNWNTTKKVTSVETKTLTTAEVRDGKGFILSQEKIERRLDGSTHTTRTEFFNPTDMLIKHTLHVLKNGGRVIDQIELTRTEPNGTKLRITNDFNSNVMDVTLYTADGKGNIVESYKGGKITRENTPLLSATPKTTLVELVQATTLKSTSVNWEDGTYGQNYFFRNQSGEWNSQPTYRSVSIAQQAVRHYLVVGDVDAIPGQGNDIPMNANQSTFPLGDDSISVSWSLPYFNFEKGMIPLGISVSSAALSIFTEVPFPNSVSVEINSTKLTVSLKADGQFVLTGEPSVMAAYKAEARSKSALLEQFPGLNLDTAMISTRLFTASDLNDGTKLPEGFKAVYLVEIKLGDLSFTYIAGINAAGASAAIPTFNTQKTTSQFVPLTDSDKDVASILGGNVGWKTEGFNQVAYFSSENLSLVGTKTILKPDEQTTVTTWRGAQGNTKQIETASPGYIYIQDGAGRLIKEISSWDDGSVAVTEYTYPANHVPHPIFLSGGNDSQRDTFYSPSGELLSDQTIYYEYDVSGQTIGNLTITWSLDEAGAKTYFFSRDTKDTNSVQTTYSGFSLNPNFAKGLTLSTPLSEIEIRATHKATTSKINETAHANIHYLREANGAWSAPFFALVDQKYYIVNGQVDALSGESDDTRFNYSQNVIAGNKNYSVTFNYPRSFSNDDGTFTVSPMGFTFTHADNEQTTVAFPNENRFVLDGVLYEISVNKDGVIDLKQLVQPFEISMPASTDGANNLTVSVRADGTATVSYYGQKYEGIFNPDTKQITISFPDKKECLDCVILHDETKPLMTTNAEEGQSVEAMMVDRWYPYYEGKRNWTLQLSDNLTQVLSFAKTEEGGYWSHYSSSTTYYNENGMIEAESWFTSYYKNGYSSGKTSYTYTLVNGQQKLASVISHSTNNDYYYKRPIEIEPYDNLRPIEKPMTTNDETRVYKPNVEYYEPIWRPYYPASESTTKTFYAYDASGSMTQSISVSSSTVNGETTYSGNYTNYVSGGYWQADQGCYRAPCRPATWVSLPSLMMETASAALPAEVFEAINGTGTHEMIDAHARTKTQYHFSGSAHKWEGHQFTLTYVREENGFMPRFVQMASKNQSYIVVGQPDVLIGTEQKNDDVLFLNGQAVGDYSVHFGEGYGDEELRGYAPTAENSNNVSIAPYTPKYLGYGLVFTKWGQKADGSYGQTTVIVDYPNVKTVTLDNRVVNIEIDAEGHVKLQDIKEDLEAARSQLLAAIDDTLAPLSPHNLQEKLALAEDQLDYEGNSFLEQLGSVSDTLRNQISYLDKLLLDAPYLSDTTRTAITAFLNNATNYSQGQESAGLQNSLLEYLNWFNERLSRARQEFYTDMKYGERFNSLRLAIVESASIEALEDLKTSFLGMLNQRSQETGDPIIAPQVNPIDTVTQLISEALTLGKQISMEENDWKQLRTELLNKTEAEIAANEAAMADLGNRLAEAERMLEARKSEINASAEELIQKLKGMLTELESALESDDIRAETRFEIEAQTAEMRDYLENTVRGEIEAMIQYTVHSFLHLLNMEAAGRKNHAQNLAAYQNELRNAGSVEALRELEGKFPELFFDGIHIEPGVDPIEKMTGFAGSMEETLEKVKMDKMQFAMQISFTQHSIAQAMQASMQIPPVINQDDMPAMDKKFADTVTAVRAAIARLAAWLQENGYTQSGESAATEFNAVYGPQKAKDMEQQAMSSLRNFYENLMMRSVQITSFRGNVGEKMLVPVSELVNALIGEMDALGLGRWSLPEDYLKLRGLTAGDVGDFNPGDGVFMPSVFDNIMYDMLPGPSLKDLRNMVIRFVSRPANAEQFVGTTRINVDLFKTLLRGTSSLPEGHVELDEGEEELMKSKLGLDSNLEITSKTVSTETFNCDGPDCKQTHKVFTAYYRSMNGETILVGRKEEDMNESRIIAMRLFNDQGRMILEEKFDDRKNPEMLPATDFIDEAAQILGQKPVYQIKIETRPSCSGEGDQMVCTQVMPQDTIEYFDINQKSIGRVVILTWDNNRQIWYDTNWVEIKLLPNNAVALSQTELDLAKSSLGISSAVEIHKTVSRATVNCITAPCPGDVITERLYSPAGLTLGYKVLEDNHVKFYAADENGNMGTLKQSLELVKDPEELSFVKTILMDKTAEYRGAFWSMWEQMRSSLTPIYISDYENESEEERKKRQSRLLI